MSPYRGQKALNLLELELQAIVSCPEWLLGPKLRSSAKAAHLCNCDLSPAPCDNIVCPSFEYYELIAELLKGVYLAGS